MRFYTRLSLFLLAALVLVPSIATAQDPLFLWTLSASDTDPLQHGGPASDEPFPVYLWMYCSWPDQFPVGLASAEVELEHPGPGPVNVLSFTPSPGVVNTGTADNLVLSVAGCPTGAHLMGYFTVTGPPDFALCLFAGPTSYSCDNPTQPTDFSPYIGFTAGDEPSVFCGVNDDYFEFCNPPTSISPLTWGRVKSLYLP
jgi:hypothetical protein